MLLYLTLYIGQQFHVLRVGDDSEFVFNLTGQ